MTLLWAVHVSLLAFEVCQRTEIDQINAYSKTAVKIDEWLAASGLTLIAVRRRDRLQPGFTFRSDFFRHVIQSLNSLPWRSSQRAEVRGTIQLSTFIKKF